MKKLIFLFLLAAPLFAQPMTETLGDGSVRTQTIVNGMVEGLRSYYRDGVLTVTQTYHEGKIHGVETWYRKDKSVYAISNFKNGYFWGSFTKFNDDNTIKSYKLFCMGDYVTDSTHDYFEYKELEPFVMVPEKKSDILNGRVDYYKNDVKIKSAEFVDGVQTGKEIWYDPIGQVTRVTTYLNGSVHGSVIFIMHEFEENFFYFGHKEKSEEDFNYWNKL